MSPPGSITRFVDCTIGFVVVSIFILDCYNMINFIIDDDIVGSSVVVAL